jgi:hypothetical protein
MKNEPSEPLMLVVEFSYYEKAFFWAGLITTFSALCLFQFLAATCTYLCFGVLFFVVMYKDGNLIDESWRVAERDVFYRENIRKIVANTDIQYKEAHGIVAAIIIFALFIPLVLSFPRWLLAAEGWD